MNKALIKETGEILDIFSSYQTIMVSSMTMPESLSDIAKSNLQNLLTSNFPNGVEITIDDNLHENFESKSNPEIFYILSDGSTYKYTELVVGVDNIREYKINNNLNI